MPWYAVSALDDALDATKALLTPLDARQWLTLALVVFFLGNAGSGGPSASFGGSTGGEPSPPVTPGLPGEMQFPAEFGDVLPIALAAVALAVIIGLAYALVGAVMEFVFVESLRRQRVGIRRYADQHFEQALRLFGFRFALGLVVAAPVFGLVLAAVSLANGQPRMTVGLVVVFVPLILLLGLVVALVDLFTLNFVVPVMILKNVGVLAGWRRFWPTLTREWKQYGAYLGVRFLLAIAVGVLVSVVGSIVAAILAAPLAVAGFFALPAVGGPAGFLSNPVALLAAVVVVLAYVVVLTAALALILVPVQTYLRYHSLLVLGDTDSEFDLIPELRREIRGG